MNHGHCVAAGDGVADAAGGSSDGGAPGTGVTAGGDAEGGGGGAAGPAGTSVGAVFEWLPPRDPQPGESAETGRGRFRAWASVSFAGVGATGGVAEADGEGFGVLPDFAISGVPTAAAVGVACVGAAPPEDVV